MTSFSLRLVAIIAFILGIASLAHSQPPPLPRTDRYGDASSRPFGSMTRSGEWRALEILEKIGSPPAIKILRDLANGAPNGQLTITAKAALTRAETRTKASR
jgi:hypothetical protein